MMQTRVVTVRERWDVLVTYELVSDSEEEAAESVQTGTLAYTEHEVINRDFEKVISTETTHVN